MSHESHERDAGRRAKFRKESKPAAGAEAQPKKETRRNHYLRDGMQLFQSPLIIVASGQDSKPVKYSQYRIWRRKNCVGGPGVIERDMECSGNSLGGVED